MAIFKKLNYRTLCFKINYKDNNIINNLIINLFVLLFLKYINLNNIKGLGFISLKE
jgi:hypothetical protein